MKGRSEQLFTSFGQPLSPSERAKGSPQLVKGSLRLVKGSLGLVKDSLGLVKSSLKLVKDSLRLVKGSMERAKGRFRHVLGLSGLVLGKISMKRRCCERIFRYNETETGPDSVKIRNRVCFNIRACYSVSCCFKGRPGNWADRSS